MDKKMRADLGDAERSNWILGLRKPEKAFAHKNWPSLGYKAHGIWCIHKFCIQRNWERKLHKASI